jgi:hypothetical protein
MNGNIYIYIYIYIHTLYIYNICKRVQRIIREVLTWRVYIGNGWTEFGPKVV